MKKIAITLGDVNGISPEITIKALNFLDLPKDKVVLIANSGILDFYRENYDLSLEKDYNIIEIPFDKNNIKPGEETEESGEFAFKALVKACALAQNKEIDAIVTAPVSKNALKMAGYHYSGQTEILEQYLANTNQHAEMLFVCEKFCLYLFTRHIALSSVAQYITKENLVNKITYLNESLNSRLKIANPRFALCALNPHAGEKGMFGYEEINEIIPAIEELRNSGIDIEGPFAADSLFTDCYNGSANYNCYIALYHDQGLIPIKLMERYSCVNTTVGLDVLRTSPAHGTAFDIAGTNSANAESMIAAIQLAIKD